MKNKIIKTFILCLAILFTFNCASFAIEENNVEKKKLTRKEKKIAKEKKKYARYTIPTTEMIPEELEPDKLTIEGSVAKSLELNLADCLELALTYNPLIKAQYSQAQATKTLKGQALSNYSPKINLGAGISRLKPNLSSSGFNMDVDPLTQYTVGEISVSQLIYDFGITQNLYHVRKLEYEAALNNIENTVNDVIYQVKNAYYMLVTEIEQERVMEDTVDQFEQTYEQAHAFYQVGMKPKIDVTIAATNLADAKANLIQAKNAVDIATATLNNVMGLPFIAKYSIEENLPYEELDVDINKLVEIANENRPALKNSVLGVKQAEQAWKLSKKSYFPTLSFQGAFGGAGNNNRDLGEFWNLGGYFQFNAINPFLVKNQIDEKRHLFEKQQYISDASVNDIYFEIQKTWANLIDAKDRVPVALLSMKMSKENYELASGRYKVGESDAIELKDAQIQYQNSRLMYFTTLYEYNREKANLEKAVGQTLKSTPVGIEEIKLKN